MNLEECRRDCAKKQQLGLPFMLGAAIAWCVMLIVHSTPFAQTMKNLLCLIITGTIFPLSFVSARLLRANLRSEGNALAGLGSLFISCTLFTLPVAAWASSAAPERGLMVLALLFAAIMPLFAWLYKSKAYRIMAFSLPVGALVIGHLFPLTVLALAMTAAIAVLCLHLVSVQRADA